MSNTLRTVVVAATLASVVASMAGQEAPKTSSTRPIEPPSNGKDAAAPAKGGSAPLLWDGLNPKAIDGKAGGQQKKGTLPKQMPAEVK